MTAAAAMTTTRNGALRQARTPADQDAGGAGEAGEAVALGQRGGGDQGGEQDRRRRPPAACSARGGKVIRARSSWPDSRKA